MCYSTGKNTKKSSWTQRQRPNSIVPPPSFSVQSIFDAIVEMTFRIYINFGPCLAQLSSQRLPGKKFCRFFLLLLIFENNWNLSLTRVVGFAFFVDMSENKYIKTFWNCVKQEKQKLSGRPHHFPLRVSVCVRARPLNH